MAVSGPSFCSYKYLRRPLVTSVGGKDENSYGVPVTLVCGKFWKLGHADGEEE